MGSSTSVGADFSTITLPDDPPAAIGCLIDFLYTGDFQPPNLFQCSEEMTCIQSTEPSTRSKFLGDLYTVAVKYRLPNLQHCVIAKLEHSPIGSSWVSPEPFFKFAKSIYDKLSKPNHTFRAYFARVAPRLIGIMTEVQLSVLEDFVALGGPFAKDLFKAQRDAFRPTELMSSEVSTKSKVRNLCGEPNELTSE